MKLYDFEPAPNPRRVRMFLAEKGIDIPRVQVNLEHTVVVVPPTSTGKEFSVVR